MELMVTTTGFHGVVTTTVIQPRTSVETGLNTEKQIFIYALSPQHQFLEKIMWKSVLCDTCLLLHYLE